MINIYHSRSQEESSTRFPELSQDSAWTPQSKSPTSKMLQLTTNWPGPRPGDPFIRLFCVSCKVLDNEGENILDNARCEYDTVHRLDFWKLNFEKKYSSKTWYSANSSIIRWSGFSPGESATSWKRSSWKEMSFNLTLNCDDGNDYRAMKWVSILFPIYIENCKGAFSIYHLNRQKLHYITLIHYYRNKRFPPFKK